MSYTLGEAARVTGRNKTTIARAIQSGKLSATRNSNGSYTIDPVELSRVFDLIHLDSRMQPETLQNTTPETTVTVAVLQERVAQLEQLAEELRTQRDQWHDQAERLTRLLIAPQPEQAAIPAPVAQPQEQQPTDELPSPRPWWRRLLG